MPSATPWWICSICGFRNAPRPVTNSLNLLPPGSPLFDAGWRAAHCEQCGAEKDQAAIDYTPAGR